MNVFVTKNLKIFLEGIKVFFVLLLPSKKRKVNKNFSTKATKVETLLPYRIKMKFRMSIKTFVGNESQDTFDTEGEQSTAH